MIGKIWMQLDLEIWRFGWSWRFWWRGRSWQRFAWFTFDGLCIESAHLCLVRYNLLRICLWHFEIEYLRCARKVHKNIWVPSSPWSFKGKSVSALLLSSAAQSCSFLTYMKIGIYSCQSVLSKKQEFQNSPIDLLKYLTRESTQNCSISLLSCAV